MHSADAVPLTSSLAPGATRFRVALAVVAVACLSLSFVARADAQGAIVANGDVLVGVNPLGHLITSGPYSGPPVGIGFDRADGLSPGCDCEGWGAGDALTGKGGHASVDNSGVRGVRLVSFTVDSAKQEVVSVTRIPSASLRVTHRYNPQSDSLIGGKVRITNYGSTSVDPRYRRVFDWDIPPTEFDEYVTLDAGTSAAITYTSDDGFATPSPFAIDSPILFTGNADDSGPADHGGLFDFDLGELAPGQSANFKLYYGATATEAAAKAELGEIGAEAYSLGQSNGGQIDGAPATYVFAATGVGGTPLCDAATSTCAPIEVSAPLSDQGLGLDGQSANPQGGRR